MDVNTALVFLFVVGVVAAYAIPLLVFKPSRKAVVRSGVVWLGFVYLLVWAAVKTCEAQLVEAHQRGRQESTSEETKDAPNRQLLNEELERLKKYNGEPSSALDYMAVASSQMFLGFPEEAIKSYDKAIEFEPTWPSLYERRGRLHYGQGDYEKAFLDFNQACLRDENPVKAESRGERLFNEFPNAFDITKNGGN